jgi:hypothetical protein
MHARVEGERIQLLTRTGLDWSKRYRFTIEALTKLQARSLFSTNISNFFGSSVLPLLMLLRRPAFQRFRFAFQPLSIRHQPLPITVPRQARRQPTCPQGHLSLVAGGVERGRGCIDLSGGHLPK